MPSNPIILVVDDNAATLKATVRILEQAGYQVAQATGGVAALCQARALRPMLVLLDVVLPDVTGGEVLRQIRADPSLALVSVVMMSAYQTTPEQQASGLDAGADGYIARPIARAELLGRVRLHLRQRELTEQLRASEARYRTLFEYAPDGVIIADSDGTYLDANASVCQMLGYGHDELVGLNALDIVHPADSEQIAIALMAIKDTSSYKQEWQFRRRDGSVFPAEVRATLTPDGNLMAVVRDITEQKRSETRMRRLVESNAQGVLFWNTEGEITGANDAFFATTGYTREELDTRCLNWTAMTPPEYAEMDRRALEEIAAKGVCAPFEKEYLRKDGSRVFILVGAANFEDSPKEGVCFVVDLTERKKLEQQFLRAQRMESIGTLAGGIAHDLNNVFGPIMMSLDLLKMRFLDPVSQELISILNASAQHGADMVRQILSFARGVEGRRMEVQVRHLIGDVEKIVRETFARDIQIRTIIPHDLWTVLGDPTQLHQVLLNLCVNARDAMPQGGTLTVSAENLTLDAHYAGTSVEREAQPGPYVLLKVNDTGIGMPPDLLEKIFDPFFTTKEIGNGTGLGLSTTLRIVKSHRGFIRVFSELGKGTTVAVYLPTQTDAATEAAAAPTAELPRGQGELILVVDDEAAVRQITKATLEAFGYRVILAANGVEAVALYASHSAEIAAVLTDMVMPIMDGLATIRVLRQMDPAVRLIAASGLATHENTVQSTSIGVKHFLPKPYTAEMLLKALSETLNRPALIGPIPPSV